MRRLTPCMIKSCLPFSYWSSYAGLSPLPTVSFNQVGKNVVVPVAFIPLRSWTMGWSEGDQMAGAIVYMYVFRDPD